MNCFLNFSREEKMKKLYVTGAAGFIGSNFTKMALKKGYTVLAVDCLTYAGHLENLEEVSKNSNFQFHNENICNDSAGFLLRKFQPDYVVNFAAESHVDRSIENPLVFIETNVKGTANLLNHSLIHWQESGKPKHFRYLQVSTDEVYGSLGANGKFEENTPLDPSSPYSSSKAAADLLVGAWNRTYDLPTIITRCSNNYGPFQFPEKLIPHMIHCALEGRPLPVYGEGKNIRDWIFVEDHCDGIFLALEKGGAGSLFCFGGESEMKNIDLVNLLCEKLDQVKKPNNSFKKQISFVKDRLGHDLRYAIENAFSRKALGFQPKVNFEEGLERTIEWYLNNQEWCKKVLSKS
jgi:dTDP-glucose 4,6-dehydratase